MFALRRDRPVLAHGDLIEVDGWPVRLSVQPRARRISLRLDSARREVVAVAPSPRRLADAAAFARSRTGWIAARLDGLPAPSSFRPGLTIQVAGETCRLERAAMRIKPRLIPPRGPEPMRLLAYGEGEAFARAAERTLRGEALRVLTERTSVHVKAMGAQMPSLAVMDARARWGSCRSPLAGDSGKIRYNWRLILAPPFVLDYVAAHECAHLAEANHGPRFWALVKRLYGDPASARSWLKANGAELHAIGD
jgi:predicted metal-dependent hydrolase